MNDLRDDSGLSSDEWLAAEYALGVLARDDMERVQARIAADSAFARLVENWQAKLAPLTAELHDVAPPAALWDRIAATLPASPDRKQLQPSLWQSLTFWRGLTAVSTVLAVACLGLLIYVGGEIGTLTKPPLIAAIENNGQRHFVATIDPARGSIAVVPASYTADATRVPELWLIPADGKPRALGVLNAARPMTISIPAALAPQITADTMLAVSLEPQGGSPTGQPTGPVIASGKLTRL